MHGKKDKEESFEPEFTFKKVKSPKIKVFEKATQKEVKLTGK